MSNLAVNDQGDVLTFNGQQWAPAPVAQNDQGQKMVYDGSAWVPHGEVVGAARGKAQGEASGVFPYIDNLVRQAANGMTFGYADEIASGLDALTGRRPSYDQALAENRAQDKAFSTRNPMASTAANIGGSIATTVAALPASFTSAAPTLVGNIAKMGGTGALLGGIQGFGEGQGGFWNRLGSAVPAAAVGGTVGAVLPIIGAGVHQIAESTPGQWVQRNIVSPVAQRIAGAIEGTPAQSLSAAAPDGTPGVTGPLTEFAQSVANPSEAAAKDRIALAIQRSGLSPEQAQRALSTLGPDATLADVNDQLMRQARMARTLPGNTSTIAENVLTGRERGRPDRVIAAFETGGAPPDTYTLMGPGQAFEQNTRNVGRALYQGDMANAGLQLTPDLQQMLEQNPTAKGALSSVMNSIAEASKGRPDFVPPTPVEIMHMVKQQLQGLGYDTMTGKPLPTQQVWREFADNFVQKLKGANPELAAADTAYAQAKSLPEYFTQGYNFLSPANLTDRGLNASSPALADALSGATPQQVAAARAGTVNVARDTVNGRGALAKSLALTKDIETGRDVQRRLAEILTPDANAEVNRMAAAENVFNKTKQNILGGSQSIDKAVEAADTGNAGIRITDRSIIPSFRERIADILMKLGAPNEDVRNAIGRLTLSQNPDENARLLREAFDILRRRSAGNPVSASLAGSAGGQLMGGP